MTGGHQDTFDTVHTEVLILMKFIHVCSVGTSFNVLLNSFDDFVEGFSMSFRFIMVLF